MTPALAIHREQTLDFDGLPWPPIGDGWVLVDLRHINVTQRDPTQGDAQQNKEDAEAATPAQCRVRGFENVRSASPTRPAWERSDDNSA
jgi:hypothetical protein